MENRRPEENLDEKIRYLNAQKRVREIRGFYAHLIAYVAVNIVLIMFNVLYHHFGYMKIKINQFYSLIIWGTIIIIHAGFVFFGKDWEQRKIRKLMDKEK